MTPIMGQGHMSMGGAMERKIMMMRRRKTSKRGQAVQRDLGENYRAGVKAQGGFSVSNSAFLI